LPDSTRRWIGSTNQRIHFLTDRYSADDPRWYKSNTQELRLVHGEIIMNGFPAKRAMTARKRGMP
jgi:anaerobic ribonucleoside-triphosphate reductase activating protein